MNEQVRRELRALVGEHGAAITADASRCEALLRERCPANKREVALLLGVLRSGVMAELRLSATGAATAGRVGMLAHRVEDELGVNAEAARWAIESWAFALGRPLEAAKPVAAAEPVAPAPAPVPAPASRPAPVPPPAAPEPAFVPAPAPVAAPAPAPVPLPASAPAGAPRRGNGARIAAAAVAAAVVLYLLWRLLQR
jgi:hypothetical protein